MAKRTRVKSHIRKVGRRRIRIKAHKRKVIKGRKSYGSFATQASILEKIRQGKEQLTPHEQSRFDLMKEAERIPLSERSTGRAGLIVVSDSEMQRREKERGAIREQIEIARDLGDMEAMESLRSQLPAAVTPEERKIEAQSRKERLEQTIRSQRIGRI